MGVGLRSCKRAVLKTSRCDRKDDLIVMYLLLSPNTVYCSIRDNMVSL